MRNPITPLVGEFLVTIGERWRITLPDALADTFCGGKEVLAVLSRERNGLLSLWHPDVLKKLVSPLVDKVWESIQEPVLPSRFAEIQRFARLWSARRWETRVDAKGRMTIPEDIRGFAQLKVKQGCVVVGAGFCIELWEPELWAKHLEQEITWFSHHFERLLAESRAVFGERIHEDDV